MTLCDTGPLVALVDDADPYHTVCTTSLACLPASPLITTWPCLTEAMYLLGCVAGITAQDRLWSYIVDGLIVLHPPHDDEWPRMRELMLQYADMPLDMADASLVSAAEQLGDYQLFTVDESLRAVRLNNGKFFEVVP